MSQVPARARPQESGSRPGPLCWRSSPDDDNGGLGNHSCLIATFASCGNKRRQVFPANCLMPEAYEQFIQSIQVQPRRCRNLDTDGSFVGREIYNQSSVDPLGPDAPVAVLPRKVVVSRDGPTLAVRYLQVRVLHEGELPRR